QLGEGVSEDRARAELETVRRRAAAEDPERYEHVRADLRRALLQLGAGVAVGAWLATVVVSDMINETLNKGVRWPVLVGGVAVVMLMTGLLACVVPASRALRIQPIR